MKQWYLFYTEGDSLFLHQTGAELQMLEDQHKMYYPLKSNWQNEYGCCKRNCKRPSD